MAQSNAEEPLVALVDDQRDVRTTLVRGLAAHGFRCHPLASGQDLLDALEYLEPDCILLDLQMPGLDGIETLRAIPPKRRTIPVVFLTSQGNIPRAVEAMQLGAADFLEKPASFEAIAEKIRAALGKTARARDEGHYTAAQAREILARLTGREREVLALAAEGLLNREIAERLHVSVRTVETHRHNAVQKIGSGRLINILKLFQVADAG